MIEIGTSRSLMPIGRDLAHAVAENQGRTTYVTRDGQRVAAIVPLGEGVSLCHYCNMLVARDREGGIHATHPRITEPWACPASRSGKHVIAATA